MRPEDHDDADDGGGPPPDPSLRQWRHPSEIAAAAAAAERPVGPPPLRRHGPIAASLAITAAASMLAGIGTLLVVTILDTTGNGSFSIGDESGTGPVGTGSSLLAGSLFGAATITTGRQPTTTQPVTTLPATTEGRQTTTENEEPLVREPELTGDGLFTNSDDDGRRLAAFVIVDDTIFTSASAIAGHDEVALLAEGEWMTATVLGRDMINDIAVLDVAEADRTTVLSHQQETWSTWEAPEAPAPGTRVVLLIESEQPIEGFIIDADHRVVATTGSSIYGALLTSARKPAGASGAGLIDETGTLLGLVVDSTEPLASVVPVETMVATGRSIRQWGVPAIEWLGIKGASLRDGGVTLHEVTSDGPAAEADLKPGDVVTRVGGVQVIDWDHLVHLVRRSGVGSTITMVIERNSLRRYLEATVGSKQHWPDTIPGAAVDK